MFLFLSMLKHSRKKQNNKILLIVVIALIALGVLIAVVQGNNKTGSNTVNAAEVDKLAQCLTEKWMKMYGASRCPHCKAQKEMFGTSFSKIDYVECTTDQVKCNIAGIKGYPTRTYQGQKFEGEQTFQQLAQIAWCEYDGENPSVSGGASSGN